MYLNHDHHVLSQVMNVGCIERLKNMIFSCQGIDRDQLIAFSFTLFTLHVIMCSLYCFQADSDEDWCNAADVTERYVQQFGIESSEELKLVSHYCLGHESDGSKSKHSIISDSYSRTIICNLMLLATQMVTEHLAIFDD